MSKEINLNDYTHSDLKDLRKAIEEELRLREIRRREEAKEAIKNVASQYGFSTEEIVPSSQKKTNGKGTRKKAAIKFRHPDNPSRTWTGRGITPVWVREWKDSGGSLDDLRVNNLQ